MTFTVRPDRRYIRTGYRSNRFLLVDIEAPAAERRDGGRPSVNLAFVLDRSGSMSGPKIATARDAVEDALNRLSPDDRFAVVVYDDQIDVVAESSLATAESRRRAVDALRRIDARGSTNLGEGWLRGCEQVSRFLSDRGVNRALLLTDGLANVGMTDTSELQGHATELRRRGVSTSTFGVGADFDERLLQAMADAGGGHFYFIESAAQIRDHMTSEVGESLEIVARDVTLRVNAPEGVTVESLSPYATSIRPGRGGASEVEVSLGDLVSQQRVSLVLRVNFPHGVTGRSVSVGLTLADRDGTMARDGGASLTSPTFEYADDRTNDLQTRDRDVDRAVAGAFAARVRLEALDLNRRGLFGEAAARLDAVAKRIRQYAGNDGELLRIVSQLETDRPMMAAPISPMAAKAAYFASATVQRSRSPEGKAQR
jgi:Ca-activated chloride channel family protein